MRKLLLAAMLMFSTPAFADYTFVIPQRPGSGTSIWAEIVAKELEPFLGEKIIIKNKCLSEKVDVYREGIEGRYRRKT